MAQEQRRRGGRQNIYRTPELWQKIIFTFVCLLLYRVGAHITVPGVDVQALTDYFANQRGGGGLLGLYDLFVGGGLSRATVFALGIMPYISASIFTQIGGAVIPQIDKMQKDEEGRKKLTQWTRYITVALAAVQGYGFALFTQGLPGAVAAPGFWSFMVPMVLVLVTGALFVMWLGEQITERGLGNGASLLIFFSIIERFWPGILDTFRFMSTGALAAAGAAGARDRDGGGRGGRRGDHRGRAPGDGADPAEDDGPRAAARGGEELHPAPHQHRRRDADHLRAVGDRGAGRDRAVLPGQPGGAQHRRRAAARVVAVLRR